MKTMSVEFLQSFRQTTDEIGYLILKFRVNQIEQELQFVNNLVYFLASIQGIKQLAHLFEISIGICHLHI